MISSVMWKEEKFLQGGLGVRRENDKHTSSPQLWHCWAPLRGTKLSPPSLDVNSCDRRDKSEWDDTSQLVRDTTVMAQGSPWLHICW